MPPRMLFIPVCCTTAAAWIARRHNKLNLWNYVCLPGNGGLAGWLGCSSANRLLALSTSKVIPVKIQPKNIP